MSAWLWLWPGLGLAQAALLGANLRRFGAQRADPGLPDAHVSLLVPARDEAGVIAACVTRLMAQEGITLEVLVLDDGSVDGTAAAARAAAPTDQRLRVLSGSEPPPGWSGKAHACQQLAAAATGDWLLFVDADTCLAPGAAARAVAIAQISQAGLVSLWPRQAAGTAGEQLMIPLLSFILLAFLPLHKAEHDPDPRFAAANGQCLLFARAAYDAIGGHAAVAGDVVEDVGLARAIKSRGLRVVVADAEQLASCRMYTGFQPLWLGFRKNLFPAFGGRPGPFLAGFGLLAVFHALPLPVALLGLATGSDTLALAAGAQLTLGLGMRLALALKLGQPLWSVLAHPIAVALLLGLGLDSWRGWSGAGVTWKGRTYGART